VRSNALLAAFPLENAKGCLKKAQTHSQGYASAEHLPNNVATSSFLLRRLGATSGKDQRLTNGQHHASIGCTCKSPDFCRLARKCHDSTSSKHGCHHRVGLSKCPREPLQCQHRKPHQDIGRCGREFKGRQAKEMHAR